MFLVVICIWIKEGEGEKREIKEKIENRGENKITKRKNSGNGDKKEWDENCANKIISIIIEQSNTHAIIYRSLNTDIPIVNY